jgi:hypothetical protein
VKDAFINEIRTALERDASLAELIQLMRAHRSMGLSRATAYEALGALRSTVERHEDRLLEAMDIVSGFCQPQHRVWED